MTKNNYTQQAVIGGALQMAKWESFLATVAAEIAPIDCATDLAQCLTGIDLVIHRHFRSAKASNSVAMYRPGPKK